MDVKIQEIGNDAKYVNLERLTFFMDGVFAITITLLVLELRLPDNHSESFSQGLLAMLPRLYIYLIAFYSIANHWAVNQRMFRHITSADTTIMWFTISTLLFITLIPATTAIIGQYPGEKLGAACFSVNSFFHACTQWLLWRYVEKNQTKFACNSDPRILSISRQVWLVIAAGWLVAIMLGSVSVYAAYISWILWPNLVAVWGNRRRKAFLPPIPSVS